MAIFQRVRFQQTHECDGLVDCFKHVGGGREVDVRFHLTREDQHVELHSEHVQSDAAQDVVLLVLLHQHQSLGGHHQRQSHGEVVADLLWVKISLERINCIVNTIRSLIWCQGCVQSVVLSGNHKTKSAVLSALFQKKTVCAKLGQTPVFTVSVLLFKK